MRYPGRLILVQSTKHLRNPTNAGILDQNRLAFRGDTLAMRLSDSLRFGGTIVRLTDVLGPRLRRQLTYLGVDRLKRSEFVLLWAKLVGIGAVRRVDRLLEPHRKILVEVCHLRALLAYEV